MIIQKSSDTKSKSLAEAQIVKLMGSVSNAEDMILLDDEIQELMNKN